MWTLIVASIICYWIISASKNLNLKSTYEHIVYTFILSLTHLSSMEGASEGGLSGSFGFCHLVQLGANFFSLCHFLSFNAFTITPSLHTSCDTYNDKMELTHKKLRNIFYFTDFSPFFMAEQLHNEPYRIDHYYYTPGTGRGNRKDGGSF